MGKNIRYAVWEAVLLRLDKFQVGADFILLYKLLGSSFIIFFMCLYGVGIYKFRFLHKSNLFIDLIKSNNTSKYFYIFPFFYYPVSREIKIYQVKILAHTIILPPLPLFFPFTSAKAFH